MAERFHAGFENTSDVFSKFGEPYDPEVDILFAWYGCECYEGEALVLFRKDGKLYEVHAYHCSCYDLEGQWEPEETDVVTLRARVESKGWQHSLSHDKEMEPILAEVVAAL